MSSKIKISEQEHMKHPFRVHSLLADFLLEDVWCIPVTLSSAQGLGLFIDQVAIGNGQLITSGAARLLFRFRLFIGSMLKWDDMVIHDHLIPGTIRARYAHEENLKFDDLPDPGSGSFVPVYKLENEYLSEIENNTVHAAVHFSRVPLDQQSWTIHMAVYVKPKGWFGRCYMLLIKLFRLWIVYPALMKAAKRNWEAYTNSVS